MNKKIDIQLTTKDGDILHPETKTSLLVNEDGTNADLDERINSKANTTGVYTALTAGKVEHKITFTGVSTGTYDGSANLTINIPEGSATPGEKGDPGKSAYAIAVDNGFKGTEPEWLASLKGEPGQPGQPGTPGTPGRGITSITKTSTSGLIDTYTITYTDQSNPDTFTVTNGKKLEEVVAHEGDLVNSSGTYTYSQLADARLLLLDGYKYGGEGLDLHCCFDPRTLKFQKTLKVPTFTNHSGGWTTNIIFTYTADDQPITWVTETEYSHDIQYGVNTLTKVY